MTAVRLPLLLSAGLLAAPLIGAAQPATAAPKAAGPKAAACVKVPSDFNGDGYADLAAGASSSTSSGSDAAPDGAVHVLYGSSAGLGQGTRTAQFFATSSTGLPAGRFDGGDRFGAALAAGYFDNDCYADLAVGAPGSTQIAILYGSSSGLNTARSQVFGRTSVASSDVEHGVGFGAALSAGDFNGDGRDDLAVGAKGTDDVTVGDDDPGSDDGGAIAVFNGSASGITTTGARWIYQDSTGVQGDAESQDGFGWSLAAGDFDGDGRADLAVGVPRETISGVVQAGGVIVLRGAAGGLGGTDSQWWDQEVAGVPGTAEAGDRFGETLAAADVTADGKADLVIGTPREAIGTLADAGTVAVLRGSSTGLTGAGALGFDESSADIPGDAAPGDAFGSSMAVADLNRDGRVDLAVGAPGKTVGETSLTGAVTVVYGVAGGLSATGAKYVDQNSAGVPGGNEDYDGFGAALRGLPGAYSGKDALVVGAPGEVSGSGSATASGAFTALPGGTSGLPGPSGFFFGPAQLTGGKPGYSGLGGSFG